MKKFKTMTGENINIEKGLEIKNSLEIMVNDINEGTIKRIVFWICKNSE